MNLYAPKESIYTDVYFHGNHTVWVKAIMWIFFFTSVIRLLLHKVKQQHKCVKSDCDFQILSLFIVSFSIYPHLNQLSLCFYAICHLSVCTQNAVIDKTSWLTSFSSFHCFSCFSFVLTTLCWLAMEPILCLKAISLLISLNTEDSRSFFCHMEILLQNIEWNGIKLLNVFQFSGNLRGH